MKLVMDHIMYSVIGCVDDEVKSQVSLPVWDLVWGLLASWPVWSLVLDHVWWHVRLRLRRRLLCS